MAPNEPLFAPAAESVLFDGGSQQLLYKIAAQGSQEAVEKELLLGNLHKATAGSCSRRPNEVLIEDEDVIDG